MPAVLLSFLLDGEDPFLQWMRFVSVCSSGDPDTWQQTAAFPANVLQPADCFHTNVSTNFTQFHSEPNAKVFVCIICVSVNLRDGASRFCTMNQSGNSQQEVKCSTALVDKGCMRAKNAHTGDPLHMSRS